MWFAMVGRRSEFLGYGWRSGRGVDHRGLCSSLFRVYGLGGVRQVRDCCAFPCLSRSIVWGVPFFLCLYHADSVGYGGVTGVMGGLASLMNGAPLVRLSNCYKGCNVRRGVVTGLRTFGPTKDIGSQITLSVVRSTRTHKILGPNTAVVRPADKGANIKLTVISAVGNCRLVLAVPRAVDLRQEGLLGTLNTRVMLASKLKNVTTSVTGTRRLHSDVPNSIVLRRFRGPTGTTIRRQAANRRV